MLGYCSVTQELIECQDAVAWLLKCILRRYVPVSYFDTAMDLLVTALELGKKSLVNVTCLIH